MADKPVAATTGETPAGKPNGEFKTADEILALDDLKREQVWVEDWQTFVWIQEWSGDGRDMYERVMLGQTNKHIRATLVAWSVVDEDGKRMFGDDKIPALAAKSGRALDMLAAKAQQMNRLTDSDIEELEKN